MFVVHNIIYGGYLKVDSAIVAFNTKDTAQRVLNDLLLSRNLRQGLTCHLVEEFEIIPISDNTKEHHYFLYDIIKTMVQIPYFTVR